MKQATKFCRCIKTVRKEKGEKSAIGICVHSILQRKGRTLKKFRCGKKERLITQKWKRKGGVREVSWAMIKEIAENMYEGDPGQLDSLPTLLEKVDIPTGDVNKTNWLYAFGAIKRYALDHPQEQNALKALSLVVKKHPGDPYMVGFIQDSIQILRARTDPEIRAVLNAITSVAGTSVVDTRRQMSQSA
jgi:hypothetical protein